MLLVWGVWLLHFVKYFYKNILSCLYCIVSSERMVCEKMGKERSWCNWMDLPWFRICGWHLLGETEENGFWVVTAIIKNNHSQTAWNENCEYPRVIAFAPSFCYDVMPQRLVRLRVCRYVLPAGMVPMYSHREQHLFLVVSMLQLPSRNVDVRIRLSPDVFISGWFVRWTRKNEKKGVLFANKCSVYCMPSFGKE